MASAAVLLTLLVLTPLFHHLPRATLAVIIVAAVLGLFRIQPLRRAWRVSRPDGLIAAVTFFTTLALAPGLHWGILIGVALSLLQYLRRTMRPHVAYLARHPEGHLVDADAHGLALGQRIAILRFDGRLYFGGRRLFRGQGARGAVEAAPAALPGARRRRHQPDRRHRAEALRRVVEELRGVGVEVHVTRVKYDVYRILESTGLGDEIGAARSTTGTSMSWKSCGTGWSLRTGPLSSERVHPSRPGWIRYALRHGVTVPAGQRSRPGTLSRVARFGDAERSGGPPERASGGGRRAGVAAASGIQPPDFAAEAVGDVDRLDGLVPVVEPGHGAVDGQRQVGTSACRLRNTRKPSSSWPLKIISLGNIVRFSRSCRSRKRPYSLPR